MNSHDTLPAAMQAEADSIAAGYHTPRRLAILNQHAALMSREDHENARRDFDAQAAIVQDLRQRLERAERQLEDDREYLRSMQVQDLSNEYQADRSAALWTATLTAARLRAKQGMPALRPLPALPFAPQPKIMIVRIPSRRAGLTPGSIPYRVATENAWKRRRRWHARQAHLTPAGEQAFYRWDRAITADARQAARPELWT